LPGDDLGAHPQPLGGEDVPLLAVGVVEQRDARRTVGVVLDRGHTGRYPVLSALEVDLAVAPFGAAAAMARGLAALGVAAAGRALGLGEPLVRLGDRAPARAGGTCLAVRHG